MDDEPAVPVRKLSHRLLMHLRRSHDIHGVDWEELRRAPGRPQFIFELLDETVRLRLLARSERDDSSGFGPATNGSRRNRATDATDKPEILDDPRLDPPRNGCAQLDWFTPEPGLWVGDANENFLGTLADAWAPKPAEAEYLGNPAFHRLFLAPRQLKPR